VRLTFDKLTSKDLGQSLQIKTPEGWRDEEMGWNAKTRSWSAKLKPLNSAQDGDFAIVFPFPLNQKTLQIVEPPDWEVRSKWGEKGTLTIEIHPPKNQHSSESQPNLK
jgi:hypothetical protein